MLKENPAADTEAHSVHTEANSLPIAELEAQLGQQVFMGQILLIGNAEPTVYPSNPLVVKTTGRSRVSRARSGQGADPLIFKLSAGANPLGCGDDRIHPCVVCCP